MLQIQNAKALYFSTTISLIDPGALDTKLAAANAPKNLGINRLSIFLARAQGKIKITNIAVEIMYTGLRPYISERGARTVDPAAIPIR